MTHLQMFVRFTDGTGRQVESIRDDGPDAEQIRRALDRAAWALMASPLVQSVTIERVEGRVAGYERSRGSYR